ncbi:MAG: M28 family peptidase [Anaerolineae bacterium]|jgi:aminopeptidase YwaD
MTSHLTEKAGMLLHSLCLELPGRRVGRPGNRAATEFFAQTIASFGFDTQCPEFECLDWTQGGAHLTLEGEPFAVLPSPYTLGCRARAPLAVVSTIEELEAIDALDKILLVQGDLAKEQLMPKNFHFYNPDHHKQIVRLLETRAPRAIVAATSRNPELAGGMYPFPLIVDGDFDIPSVYMTDQEGERLASYAGRELTLEIEAERIPATGCNVIARKGDPAPGRAVICAHIDAKDGTPGALDNGTGVVILLLLAELMAGYTGDLGLEIVALNGEDHYSAAGEVQYISHNRDRFSEIVLAINLDLAGYREGQTAYSLYGCPDEIATAIRRAFSSREDTVEGEPWYQSDHSIFIQNQVPAMAITSDRLMELSTHVTHTDKDRPELVDLAKLESITRALRDLLLDLDRILP